jgi:hypothetical protein
MPNEGEPKSSIDDGKTDSKHTRRVCAIKSAIVNEILGTSNRSHDAQKKKTKVINR